MESKPSSLGIIPSEVGIAIPSDGIQENDVNFSIGVNSAMGSVYGSPFTSVQGVGFFKNVTIVFDFPLAGRPCEINITLSATMDVVAGNLIKIYLPRFSSSAMRGRKIGNSWLAFWNQSASTLYLTSQSFFIRGTAFVVSIPSDFSIILPELGLQDSSIISISAIGQNGKTIASPQIVGNFQAHFI